MSALGISQLSKRGETGLRARCGEQSRSGIDERKFNHDKENSWFRNLSGNSRKVYGDSMFCAAAAGSYVPASQPQAPAAASSPARSCQPISG